MKREYICVALVIVTIATANKLVPDARAITPPEPTIVETASKEINKHIGDAFYITYLKEPIKVELVEISDRLEDDELYGYPEQLDGEAPEDTPFEDIDIEDVEDESDTQSQSPGLIPLGTYTITAYEWTGNPCANGNYPSEGYTVACNDLPLGSTVYIDGVGYRTVEDRGGGGYGWMDLYLGDVGACYEWGVQYREVWLVE